MNTPEIALGWRGWRQLLLAWLTLAVVMSANGVFRELVLRPRLGDRVASVLSALLGVALLLLTTRLLLPPLVGSSGGALWRVSLALVAATVAFETALGRLVDHKSWRELLEHYALWQGELWPLVLLVLALTPFAWARWWPPAAVGRG